MNKYKHLYTSYLKGEQHYYFAIGVGLFGILTITPLFAIPVFITLIIESRDITKRWRRLKNDVG